MPHPIITEVLARIESDPNWVNDYETLRDRLGELPSDSVPELIPVAAEAGDAQSVFAISLADFAHPEGEDLYLRWLDGEQELKFNAVAALNALTGNKIDINTLVDGGWINDDKLETAADGFRTQWRTARPTLISAEEWAHKRSKAPVYTEFEKHLNLIEGNPDWVMLGTGVVKQPTGPLPAGAGQHVLGATAHFGDAATCHDVVVVVDSSTQSVLNVFHRLDAQWYDVTDRAEDVQPRYWFAAEDKPRTGVNPDTLS